MNNGKVILVTGANKGIGYSIVRTLAKKSTELSQKFSLILGSRDAERGNQAVNQLRQDVPGDAYTATSLQLDVSNKESVLKAVEEVKKQFGGIDVLINNAGVFPADRSDGSEFKPIFDSKAVQLTLSTNYFGLTYLTNALLPLLRSHGRIIHLSSTLGNREQLSSEDLKTRFGSQDLTQKELDSLMQDFQTAVDNGTYSQKGWPKTIYGVSKIGVTAHAGVVSRSKEVKDKNILAFAVCPGWCRTDMAGARATKSADQGAETPVLLATAPDSEITHGNGKFWKDGAVHDW